MIDDDQVYSLVSAERRALIDTLERLSETDWATASLCDGWTVRHVVAHLASLLDLPMARWGLSAARHMSYHRAANELADRYAAKPTAALVGILRRNTERRYKPPLLPACAPLVDIVTHSVDIALPLGAPVARTTPAAQVALEFLTSKRSKRVRKLTAHRNQPDMHHGLKYVPTDGAWVDGPDPTEPDRGLGDPNGAIVRGPGALLVALLSGRLTLLDRLDGEGTALIRERRNA